MRVGTIAVCCAERSRSALFNVGLEALEKHGGRVQWHVGGHIPTNRTSAVREMEGEWLFFLDDDVLVREDTLTRLLANEVPVVSAAVVNRHAISFLAAQTAAGVNVRPALGRGLHRVGFVSTSALLVRREVFEQVNPVFRYDVGELDATGATQGEDVWFCRQLRAACVPIYLDHDAPVGHLAEAIVEPASSGRVGVFVGGRRLTA